jgi:hypothetical protein
MKQFDVTLRCVFVLTIEASTKKEARELALQEMNDNPPKINFDVIDVERRAP